MLPIVRGLWLENQKLAFRNDLPPPQPPPGELLVRVRLAGICNTDLELIRGYYPFAGIPGHEFVGDAVGTRVVGEINAVCGSCPACRRGHRSHCENRSTLGIAGRNGAFAEWLTLPRENLHQVPEELSDEEAVFVEPVAAALEIQEQIRIGSDDRVLVVGDGKLGQLVAQTLSLTGCRLTVLGRHPGKLALLANHGIQTSLELAEKQSFDVAVECSGSPSGFDRAREALRPRGTLVLKSTYAGKLTVDASALVVNEITVIGSRCGPFDKALQLLRDHRVEVRPLIEATYSLDEGIAAFEHARRPGALKVLIKP